MYMLLRGQSCRDWHSHATEFSEVRLVLQAIIVRFVCLIFWYHNRSLNHACSTMAETATTFDWYPTFVTRMRRVGDMYLMSAQTLSLLPLSNKQRNLKLGGPLCWVHRLGSRVEFGSIARTQQSRFSIVCFHLFCLCQLSKQCIIWNKSKKIKKIPVWHLKFQSSV